MATVDLEHLRAHGYVRVEQAVEPGLVRAALDVVGEVVGIDLDDPATWRMDSFSPPVWGHQVQWDLRQHAPLHAVFAEVLGQEALLVSQDGFGIKPPMERYPGRAAAALPLHWDADPRDGFGGYQGVLYLSDVPVERGPFVGVPGVYADLEGWLERHPGSGLELEDPEGHAPVPVPGRAGDLVIFDARLPHGNAPNHGDAPRVVQYVTMYADHGDEAMAASFADLYRSGRATPGLRGRPGWDEPQPWPPAQLTPLGRRLAGVDPWPAAARTPRSSRT